MVTNRRLMPIELSSKWSSTLRLLRRGSCWLLTLILRYRSASPREKYGNGPAVDSIPRAREWRVSDCSPSSVRPCAYLNPKVKGCTLDDPPPPPFTHPLLALLPLPPPPCCCLGPTLLTPPPPPPLPTPPLLTPTQLLTITCSQYFFFLKSSHQPVVHTSADATIPSPRYATN